MHFSVSPGIRSLPLFPLESEDQLLKKYNLQRLIRMASNENCYGPSPLAVQILEKTASEFHRYPDVYGITLRNKLSEILKVNPSQIVLGNGSTELVGMIVKTFLQPREKCLTAHETFPIYRMSVTSMNAVCETVPLLDDHYHLDGLLGAIGNTTRVIFIANPNNPTGTVLSRQALQAFLKRVPSNVLVVVDEAYREYAGQEMDCLGDIARHPNLIVLRTFSKVYGLAGLRVGYAICSDEAAEHLGRAALPYGVNKIAQLAAAAALVDQAHVAACVGKNLLERERLQKEFSARNYRFVPSQTNFILLKAKDPENLREGLLRKGIHVAALRNFHVPDGIRITLGTAEENDAMLSALSGL